ncbi:hypothetical protein CVIRNUC_009981 [Coccomyxa viridis]|uniref:Uncharacterized protein n=1 Tax=Coccomyxa viridis TaxID=1274662 RepID=A0AAV1IHP2_9CHLO|nr:hypothetical protein CVIRNUC_009981 [Coccomyxa viridis]
MFTRPSQGGRKPRMDLLVLCILMTNMRLFSMAAMPEQSRLPEEDQQAAALSPHVPTTSLSQEQCYKIMEGKVQQVAMMFLISNKFVQEEVWADWLLPVADLVHPDIGCYPDVKKCYTEHVLTTPARSVYDEQGLYNFYVHSKPDTPPFKEGSVFAGRTIETLVKTKWGTHSLSKATRLLLTAALQNPLNQRFVLMCGTSIPLRPARFTYTQLLAEQRSRFHWFWYHEEDVKAEEGLRDTFRWPVPMHEEYPKLKHNIGKHSQFWAMNRKHAQIVTDDTFIDGLFDRHCYHSISGRKDIADRQWCVSDEQYVGTVLNRALGKASRAEIKFDDPAMLNWVNAKGFQPEDINLELILHARNTANMSGPSDDIWKERARPIKKLCKAIESPQWLVMEMNRTLDDMCAEHRATQGGRLLSSLTYYESCPLFLRKFLAPGTPEKLIDLLHELRITTTIQSAVDSSR